jgi:transcription-repair coupling factor (superfamily II helicase)
MKVVFFEDWANADARVKGTTDILRQLANLAENRKAA